MRTRHLLLAVLLICAVGIGSLSAQTHLSVPLNEQVYSLLENAERRNLIERLPAAQPYTKEQVRAALAELEEKRSRLSPREREVLDGFLEQYSAEEPETKPGAVTASGPLGPFEAGMQAEGDWRVNFNNLESWHMYNSLLLYIAGDIGEHLSYYGAAGATLDKVAPDLFYRNLSLEGEEGEPWYYITGGEVQFYDGELGNYTAPGTFAPYQFTARWDGHHSDLISKGLHDGVAQIPTVGLKTEDEIAASFYDGNLLLRSGRFRREWGYGDGSLYLSGTARPFEGGEVHLQPAQWFDYSFVVGSLGDWFIDSYIGGEKPQGLDAEYSEQKMYSLQQFTLAPLPWLSFTGTASAIWGKRFEPAYLSPLLMPFIVQEFNGDFDNVAITGGFEAGIPNAGDLYFTLFLDETTPSGFDTLFTYTRNMYAYQGGWQYPVPGLPFTTLTLQYTKINPFVYGHYPETNYPTFDTPVSMNYTHEGENLGYFLPPNSDEILVKIEALPRPRLRAGLSYQLIRHGTNNYVDSDGDGFADPAIYGDINIAYDYPSHGDYPLKDFLNDGVYDWNHVAQLEAEYRLPDFPLSIGLRYIFSYTYWETNGRSVSVPGPVTMNTLGLYFSLFEGK